jgi:hypothetical protein
LRAIAIAASPPLSLRVSNFYFSFMLLVIHNKRLHLDKRETTYTVLRARIIFLKKVHPAKRARAQELYIVSSYTYAFNETFTCVWIFLWSVSLEWQEAHLDDGFTQTFPPASPQIFK